VPGVAAAPAQATAPAAPAAKPDADANAKPAAPDATLSGPYSYQVDGRRDPFQSLTATTTDEKAPRPTGAGIAGIRVDELSVRGVMRSRERLVAMITGPDNRTYVVHPGDKLADGTVKNINPQGLVLTQEVNDPRAKQKTREVRKLLRSEDEKE
jgi:Tfp pilus assembly protein PilP